MLSGKCYQQKLTLKLRAEPEAEGEAPRQLVCEPVQIKILPDERVVAISCRARVSFARTADGRVFAFGFSKDHALGSEGTRPI